MRHSKRFSKSSFRVNEVMYSVDKEPDIQLLYSLNNEIKFFIHLDEQFSRGTAVKISTGVCFPPTASLILVN